jgi:hypothetical protein
MVVTFIANCTFEISSQPQKDNWLLSFSGCSQLLTDNDCDLHQIFDKATSKSYEAYLIVPVSYLMN